MTKQELINEIRSVLMETGLTKLKSHKGKISEEFAGRKYKNLYPIKRDDEGNLFIIANGKMVDYQPSGDARRSDAEIDADILATKKPEPKPTATSDAMDLQMMMSKGSFGPKGRSYRR